MYYLITGVPVLMTHGTYHYTEIDKHHALKWLEDHHKHLELANSGSQGVEMPFVQLLSKEIDRYLPQAVVALPALPHNSEVLVVRRKPQQPGHHNQTLTIDILTFALLKRCEPHHAAE
jgi:hypothetical protein